jgi:hypothetical protein
MDQQIEMRMFAMYQEPAKLPDVEIETMTFEQTLAAALEFGMKRFDRKTMAKLCGIHYPHFPDLVTGRRPFPAKRLYKFCMITACDYPRQWLDIQERKEREAYKAASAKMLGEFIQQAMGRAA